ncbi:MAG TPA: hypothetical protein ENO07_01365, partial [candidate division Zixibacteria bacterium]|nr:hypothetical protein [candidate division Zixibacteria bacterium]
METHVVKVDNPKELNLIFGMTHFIKSVEDIYEIMVCAVPNIKFGMAFCEASQDRLIRTTGTDDGLVKLAADNMLKIKCGHTFLIFLGNVFPINVLN